MYHGGRVGHNCTVIENYNYNFNYNYVIKNSKYKEIFFHKKILYCFFDIFLRFGLMNYTMCDP